MITIWNYFNQEPREQLEERLNIELQVNIEYRAIGSFILFYGYTFEKHSSISLYVFRIYYLTLFVNNL